MLSVAPQYEKYTEMQFMQYAAAAPPLPPPFGLSLRAWLDNHIPGQWMWHEGPTEWPLHFHTCNFSKHILPIKFHISFFLQIAHPSAIHLTPATSPNKQDLQHVIF